LPAPRPRRMPPRRSSPMPSIFPAIPQSNASAPSMSATTAISEQGSWSAIAAGWHPTRSRKPCHAAARKLNAS
jgi:hypothetical protein